MPFADTWKTHPFVKITPAFILGILLQWYVPLKPVYMVVVLLVAGMVLAVISLQAAARRYVLRWVQGICILVWMVWAGMALVYVHTTGTAGGVPENSSDITAYRATIHEPLSEKEKTFKTTAYITAVHYRNSGWKKVQVKILLYVRKKDTLPPFVYGQQLLFNRPLQDIRNSGNPGAFDYRQYCAFRHMHYQVFLDEKAYVLLPGNRGSRLQSWLYNSRQQLVNLLRQNIPGAVEQGVAEALLLGYRDDLDKTLLQSYNNTGVVHIIAISGLHLGMIYGVMAAFFSLLPRKKSSVFARALAMLLVIWLFTLLAGAVPSILRAAVMFSFIVVAGMLQRKNSICNSLAASACSLLLCDPCYLWDVGFQLSYTAVLSIVLFRQPVYNWFRVQNPLLRQLWQLMAITLSAQVLTLPLVLYYFHRFPLFFLVSNLVAVPLSGLILYGLLLLLLLQWWAMAAKALGWVLGCLTAWLNTFILHMDRLPYAAITQVNLSAWQVVLLYIAIVSCCCWLLYCNKKACWITCSCLFLWLLAAALQTAQLHRQQKLVVYSMNRLAAAEIITAGTGGFWGDSTIWHNPVLLRNYLLPAHTSWQVTKTRWLRHQVYRCHGKTIVFCTKPVFYCSGQPPLPVDILVLSGNPAVSVAQLQACFACKQLVFDGSNPLWKIEKWKKACDSLHLRFHSVPEQGAFIADL
jgi:competence protein ComEC